MALVALLVMLPLGLWAVVAERNSWRPRTLSGKPYQPLHGSLAFSADGRLLPTLGHGVVRLWDVSNARPTLTLQGPRPAAHAVAFSPDGTTVASPSEQREDDTRQRIMLWSSSTGKLAQILKDDQPAFAFAFAPCGRVAASGTEVSQVVLWDVPAGKVRRRLYCSERIGHVVRSVSFSPDGASVAATGSNHLFFWDVDTARRVRSLAGVHIFAYSPSGKYVAVAGDGAYRGGVVLCDVRSGRPVRRLAAGASLAESVCFSPDGTALAAGGNDGAIHLWNVDTGQLQRSIQASKAGVTSVVIAPDATLLASGSVDGTVKLWRIK